MHNPRVRPIIQPLIQPHQNDLEDKASQNRHAKHGRHDAITVPEAVVRHVPDVASRDVAELRERVDHGDCDGALGWGARERGGNPRVEYDEACVGRRLEEERDVARRGVECGHGDDEADKAADDGADNVPEAFLRAVRVPGVDERDDAGEGPRWRGHEQCGDVAEAQRAGKRRKEGVEGEADDVGSKGEHHDVDFAVFDGHDETCPGRLLSGVFVGFAYVFSHAEHGNGAFFLGEAARVVWKVRQDEDSGDGDDHCCGALNPVEPSPSTVAEGAFHVGEHGGADERREGVGDEVAAEENGITEREFTACIPFREDQKGAWQESGFDKTDEKADGYHACEVVRASRESRDHAPKEHDDGDVKRRSWDAVDNHI